MDFRKRRSAAPRQSVIPARGANAGRPNSASACAPVTRSRAAAAAAASTSTTKTPVSQSFKAIATSGGSKFKRKVYKVHTGVKEVTKPTIKVEKNMEMSAQRPRMATPPQQRPRLVVRRPSVIVKRRSCTPRATPPHSTLLTGGNTENPRKLMQWDTRYNNSRGLMLLSRSVCSNSSIFGIIAEQNTTPSKNESTSFSWEKNAKQMLLEAICRDDAEIIKELAMKDEDFVKDLEGERALVTSVRADARRVIVALLNEGTNPNTPLAQARWEEDGYTPLHAAVHHGHVGVIDLLIKSGAYVDPTTAAGLTPLHLAAMHDRVDCCVALVSAGADFTARDRANRTPWDLAAAFHSTAVCHFFQNFFTTGTGFGN